MSTPFASLAAAWLLTYAVHSTLLLGATWLLLRLRPVGPAARNTFWKVAMLGGILTAAVQATLDIRPAGTVALGAPVASPGSSEAPAALDGVEWPGDKDAGAGAADNGTEAASAVTPATPGATPSVAAVVAYTWLAVAAALLLWYAGRRLVLVGRLGDRRGVSGDEWRSLLATLRAEADIRRHVRLTASQAISSPVALGASEICLPVAALADLTGEQRRAMLAHELAHLVRRDPQWLALACVVERAFFFQPLNRLARHGLQESAEYLADDWAARRSGGVSLARCLVKVAEWIEASPLGVPVAGMAEQRSQLSARVTRLLERTDTPPARHGPAMLLSLATLGFTAMFAPGVAGDAMPSPERPAVEASDLSGSAPAVEADTAVVRALIARLRDEDAEVRRAAADALGRIGNALAIPGLVGALDDAEPEVRHAALDALSGFERGVPAAPIRRMLAADDPDARQAAADMLGDMRDRASAGAIAGLLGDADADVRQAAVHALGHIGDPAAASSVARALTDADPDVRQEATQVMEELGGAIPDATLAALLRDQDADVRQQAAQYVSERRVAGATVHVVRLLDDPSADVRHQAVETLTELRTPESDAALRRALEHQDPTVRRTAVEYFGEEDDE